MIGIDDDVYQWLVALRNDGLDAWPYEVVAWSRFVKRAKDSGYWNKLLEVYPLSGKTIDCCKYKLKVLSTLSRIMTVGGSSSTFTSEKYSPRTGLKGFNIGGGAVLVSDFNPNLHFTAANNAMFSFGTHLEPGNTGATDQNLIGCTDATQDVSVQWVSGLIQARLNSAGATATTQDSGVWTFNRDVDSSNIDVFKNLLAGVAHPAAVTVKANAVFNIGGRSTSETGSARTYYALLGQGFTSADCLTMNQHLLALLLDLRRALRL